MGFKNVESKLMGEGRPGPLNKTAVKSLELGVGEVDMERRELGRGWDAYGRLLLRR